MNNLKSFQLKFVREERHFLLPTVKTIIIAQNLYDILFQYVINPEREENLRLFLNKLETHIKSKSKAPFSIPYSELEFLEEGLQELRLLNWIELDVAVCELIVEDADEEDVENILEFLENYLMFNKVENTNHIYIYPDELVRY